MCAIFNMLKKDFFPVVVHCHSNGFSIVGDFLQDTITYPQHHYHISLWNAFQAIHPSLQGIFRNVNFQMDDGLTLLMSIQESNKTIFVASDASYKDNRSTHAWIISTRKISDIMDPLLHISGLGPVHGPSYYLSFGRGELQGITAITILSKLLSEFYGSSCKVSTICDNLGVINVPKDHSTHYAVIDRLI